MKKQLTNLGAVIHFQYTGVYIYIGLGLGLYITSSYI